MSFKINISVSQFSELIGCSITHVRTLISSDTINSIKVGKNYKFYVAEAKQYLSSKENSVASTPIVFTKENLEEKLIDYPNLITTQEFADFFDITDTTALTIIKNIPSIFYGKRGGYKIRKAVFIEYILENQTIQPSHSGPNDQPTENLKE